MKNYCIKKDNIEKNSIKEKCALLEHDNNGQTEQDEVEVSKDENKKSIGNTIAVSKRNGAEQNKTLHRVPNNKGLNLTPQTLQQAIIWSDILDKPVSKRRRERNVWR